LSQNVLLFQRSATTTLLLFAMTTTITDLVVLGYALPISELTVGAGEVGVNVNERLVFILADGVENSKTGGASQLQGTTENGTESITKLQGQKMLNGWLNWRKIMLRFQFGLTTHFPENSGRRGV